MSVSVCTCPWAWNVLRVSVCFVSLYVSVRLWGRGGVVLVHAIVLLVSLCTRGVSILCVWGGHIWTCVCVPTPAPTCAYPSCDSSCVCVSAVKPRRDRRSLCTCVPLPMTVSRHPVCVRASVCLRVGGPHLYPSLGSHVSPTPALQNFHFPRALGSFLQEVIRLPCLSGRRWPGPKARCPPPSGKLRPKEGRGCGSHVAKLGEAAGQAPLWDLGPLGKE